MARHVLQRCEMDCVQRDVLIVSNTPLIREVFHDMLVAVGYECLLAADGSEGIEMFRGWRPSLVLTDLNLPAMSGMELLQRVRQEDTDAAVIVVCGMVLKQGGEVVGFLDVEGLRSACLKLGAYALLQRPIEMEDLLATIEGALYSRQIARRQRHILERRWGAIRPMASVSELLAMFATVFAVPPVHRSQHQRYERGDSQHYHPPAAVASSVGPGIAT